MIVIMMMDYNGSWGWAAWLGMALITTVVLVAIGAVAVLATRTARAPSAFDILDRRLALGEITDEQYLNERELLGSRGSPTAHERRRP